MTVETVMVEVQSVSTSLLQVKFHSFIDFITIPGRDLVSQKVVTAELLTAKL